MHEELFITRAHSKNTNIIHTTRVYRKTSMSHASSPSLVCGARTLCAVYAGTARCGMGRLRTAASLSCAFVGLLYYLETLIKLLERLIKTALLRAPSAESLRCLSWSMILVTWLRELD